MPELPARTQPKTVLAFDFGLRRIGIAVGQQITASASALEAVTNGEAGPDWGRIAALVSDWRPAVLVVGIPTLADGGPTSLSSQVNHFMSELRRYDLPVEGVDERFTSREAAAILKQQRASGLRRRITKTSVDSMAAKLIAERWLAGPGAID